VNTAVLSRYRMPPLIVPHYTAEAAARQKLRALRSRARPQARDVFDLWVLSPQVGAGRLGAGLGADEVQEARERIFSIGFNEYRDAVITYLGPDDQPAHDSPGFWDEIRLQVVSEIEGGPRDEV